MRYGICIFDSSFLSLEMKSRQVIRTVIFLCCGRYLLRKIKSLQHFIEPVSLRSQFF